MERPTTKKNPARDSSFKVLVRDSTVYAIGRIALSALDLALLPIYTRVLSPEEFGLISLAAAFMAVVALLAPFGLDTALGRFFFDHSEDGREHRAAVGTLVIAIVVVGFLIACGLSAAAALGIGFSEGLTPHMLLILIWTGFFSVFSTLWLQLLQLRRQPRLYVVFALAHAFVRAGLTLLLVWALARGPIGWGEAYLITSVAFGAVSIVLARREISLAFQYTVLKEAVRYALPVLLHQIAGWTTSYASRFMLNHFAALRAVGVFQVAFGIGQVMSLIVTSFNFAYAPRFMATAARDPDQASAEFGTMATYYLAAIVGIALAITLFAEEIVAIAASDSYGEAGALVPIVVATFVLQGVYYLLTNPIFFSKTLTRVLPTVTITGAAVNIAANYALIPKMGALGAAWAGLGTNVVVVFGAYALGRRALRIRYDVRRISAFSTAAVALVWISEWLTGFSVQYYQEFLIQLAAATAYLAFLWSTGIVDLATMRRAVSGRKAP